MAQYDNLKDYFYGEYGTELKSAISSQILADGSNKNISDITIISLKCDDDIASNVTITLGIAANVVDFPTPEPAKIPTRCPFPIVFSPSIALIPRGKTSSIGFLSIGLMILALVG